MPGASSIILMDFAPTVAAMARLIRRIDVPNHDAPLLESMELTHANAKEVAESVEELIQTPGPLARSRRPQGGR